jgi:putative transposase
VSDHQADYPIATMCRVLGVSSSGYHAWVKRRPSQRAETDAVLIAAIRAAQLRAAPTVRHAFTPSLRPRVFVLAASGWRD